MEVIRPGARVWLGEENDKFEATVTSVRIDMDGRTTYLCAWWSGREFKEFWIDAPLVKTAGVRPDTVRLGFAPTGDAS